MAALRYASTSGESVSATVAVGEGVTASAALCVAAAAVKATWIGFGVLVGGTAVVVASIGSAVLVGSMWAIGDDCAACRLFWHPRRKMDTHKIQSNFFIFVDYSVSSLGIGNRYLFASAVCFAAVTKLCPAHFGVVKNWTLLN